MNNKNKICVLAMSAMAIVAFVIGYSRSHQSVSNISFMLDENVEALSRGEGVTTYTVMHSKYYDPVTNLLTPKCTAFSYENANDRCTLPHNHGATYCCTVNCNKVY